MNPIRYSLLIGLLISCMSVMAQDKAAYRLFSETGKPLKYKKALKKMLDADVVLFGELHNDPISHWLQYEVLSDLVSRKGATNVHVGAEMFERHQEAWLQDYLQGAVDEKTFVDSAKPWPNYDTDYRPVVEYCKAQGVKFVGTNVPRRYARKVMIEGPESLESLPEAEKSLLTPLPFEIDYELPSYVAMKELMGGHGGGMDLNKFVAAQAVKDATMAHFILENWQNGELFYHLNGAYHSDSKEGIAWYLKKARPELGIVNLTVVKQADLDKVEKDYLGKADIIIVVPETMTVSYR